MFGDTKTNQTNSRASDVLPNEEDPFPILENRNRTYEKTSSSNGYISDIFGNVKNAYVTDEPSEPSGRSLSFTEDDDDPELTLIFDSSDSITVTYSSRGRPIYESLSEYRSWDID